MAAEQDDPQTSMQFCKECNNLMYPKEVRETENTESRLVYVCKVLAGTSPRGLCSVRPQEIL